MPRPLRSVLAVVAGLAALAGCGCDASPPGLVYGISGERPEAWRDSRLRALDLRHARVVVSWDLVARGRSLGDAPDAVRFPGLADEQRRLRAWFAAARAAGIDDVLLAVKASRDRPRELPDPARYGAALRALLEWVADEGRGVRVAAVSPWNEPELSSATRDAPQVAGGLFAVVREVCEQRGCTPVAGDFVDRAASAGYVRAYMAGAGDPAPPVWAWHAYEDGWDRRRDDSMPRLRRFLEMLPDSAQVWLAEQGGIVRRRAAGDDGRSEQSVAAAAADLRFLLDRATTVDPRVRRFYLYQWQGEPAPRWDSGLIAPGGQTRGAYCAFARAAAPRRSGSVRVITPGYALSVSLRGPWRKPSSTSSGSSGEPTTGSPSTRSSESLRWRGRR